MALAPFLSLPSLPLHSTTTRLSTPNHPTHHKPTPTHNNTVTTFNGIFEAPRGERDISRGKQRVAREGRGGREGGHDDDDDDGGATRKCGCIECVRA